MFTLYRKAGLAIALAGVVAIIAAHLVGREDPESPPLTGWMENFTMVDGGAKPSRGGFVDEAGRTLTLEAFRGKIVVVNFWATWCGPCIREMPSLARLQRKLGGEDFTVIALSEDRKGWSVMRPFLDRAGLNCLTAYHDRRGLTLAALKGRRLPTTVLIGRDGREIGRLEAPAEWDNPEAVALIQHYMGK